ncbi:hypothetical protein ACSQ67_010801 [Phaseolus vulgaris]
MSLRRFPYTHNVVVRVSYLLLLVSAYSTIMLSRCLRCGSTRSYLALKMRRPLWMCEGIDLFQGSPTTRVFTCYFCLPLRDIALFGGGKSIILELFFERSITFGVWREL